MTPNLALTDPAFVGAAGASGGGLEALIWAGGQTSDEHEDKTESYDGTTFTNESDLPYELNSCGGNGNSSDALCVNGSSYANNDCGTGAGYGMTDNALTWNGSVWGSEANTSLATRESGCGGNSSGGLRVAGNTCGGGAGNYLDSVEEYNGSTWGAGGTYPLNIRSTKGCGIGDAIGLCFNGEISGGTVESNQCNSYDGTSWTGEGNVPYQARALGGDGLPDGSEACSFGGYDHVTGDRDMASTYISNAWTDRSPLPDPISSGVALYVSTTEMYLWGGIVVPPNTDTLAGVLWDGASYSVATGTLNNNHARGIGGCNA